jgi:hypothetical protein
VRAVSEPEDERERFVDGAQLTGGESPGGAAETLGVDDGGLLDEDTRGLPVEVDARPEARWPNARRRRSDERRAQVQKLISLHDHGVPRAALLTTACAAW